MKGDLIAFGGFTAMALMSVFVLIYCKRLLRRNEQNRWAGSTIPLAAVAAIGCSLMAILSFVG